jgi:energy-coupling factor transporter transmembrane protein EcfT
MLKRIYDGFLYKPDRLKINPYMGILVISIQFGFLILNKNWLLTLLLLFIIVENILFRNIKGALSILWALLPIIVVLGLITYFFSGWIIMYRVLMRLLVGGLGFSLFFSLTNPSDLTRSFEKIKIPSKIAMIPSLALMMIPRIAKDAEDTFTTLRIRGEIKGIFLRWLPKVLAIFIASVIYRSEFLAQSLYFKGFGIQKRTHYRKIPFGWIDIVRFLTWSSFIVCFILFERFNLFHFFI